MIIPYILVAVATGAYVELQHPLKLETPVTLTIKPGQSLRATLAELQKMDVFASGGQELYLHIWARLSHAARHIKAGEYRIKPGTSPLGLLTLFSSGQVVVHQLTLVDGWQFAQAWAAIAADKNIRHTLAPDTKPQQIMAAIGHPGQAAEGRFFPDSYHFPKGETDVAFLRRAYRNMAQHLQHSWAGRASGLPYDKAYDALIMASLVEKETAQADERRRIAGVFVRRLEIGMKLQTDPSVIYGLGSHYTGDITTRDLKTDTPYNTYTRSGLPPTPICLPGQAALTAALHPASGKALYFVSKGDGSHVFSDTLAQQNAAVRRYQLHKK